MAHIAINAMSLRKGGGLQVIQGLVSRLDDRHRYSILWTDSFARSTFERAVAGKTHFRLENPLGKSGNVDVFRWGMAHQKEWLSRNKVECVLGVNHHYPSGAARQVIYHLNVLRFSRPRGSILSLAEISDRLRDWRSRKALGLADVNVFESRMLLDIAANSIPGGKAAITNPHVVYIGLDENRSSPPQTTQPVSSTILAVTSPAPHKDNETLIRMLDALKTMDASTDWRIDIAGGSGESDFPDLVALATKLRIREHIRFLGFTDHDTLAQLGSQSLCLVSTSLVESFCMVALEAMSWGCPAIVADTSCMPESVGDAGILAKPSDGDDFARQVIALKNVPGLRDNLVARGFQRAASMTWTAAARQLENVFDALLQEKPI